MKVWKMMLLQVVTTTPAPAQWNFLHFIIASFQTLPQSLFAAGRSRDRIGEKSVGGKHVPKTMKVYLSNKKNAPFQNANHQLLQTVTLLFPQLGGHKISPWKGHQKWVHLPRSTWQPLRLGNLLSLQGPELGLKILRTRQTATAWGDKQVGIAGKRHLKITLTVSQHRLFFVVFFSRKRFRVCCIFEVFLTEVFLTNPIFFVFYRFLVVLRVFLNNCHPSFWKTWVIFYTLEN